MYISPDLKLTHFSWVFTAHRGVDQEHAADANSDTGCDSICVQQCERTLMCSATAGVLHDSSRHSGYR